MVLSFLGIVEMYRKWILKNFNMLRTPPQFFVYSFSHTDINKCDLDVTGGWIHAYLFCGSISAEDPC